MIEEVWRTCPDPTRMLDFLGVRASHRKLRLFLVASARQQWPDVPDGEFRDAVVAAERYADGAEPAEHIIDTSRRFLRYSFWDGRYGPQDTQFHQSPTFHLVRMSTYPDHRLRSLTDNMSWPREIAPFHRSMASLIRDIFHPYRPFVTDPRWLTPTTVAIAYGIYVDRAFDRLPILADALEDAGCENPDLLAHCRSQGPHVRGCWAVDRVLGKG